MSDVDFSLAERDRAYASIMARIVETGQAPHFTELAHELGIAIDRARLAMHDLCAITPGWMHPGTDYLASFPPFNVQPTQYRITIDDHPGWFGQCGFESLAVRWLVPESRVRIEAPCLDCGEPMTVEMQGEQIIAVEPDTIVGYSSQPVGGEASTRPFR